MINHVVVYKLKDRTPENIEKTRAILATLGGKVPFLRYFEIGVDVLHSEKSYDLVLLAKFDNLADLQAYQDHPAHQEVIKYTSTVRESTITVDYEGT
jgi:hypothetical protein